MDGLDRPYNNMADQIHSLDDPPSDNGDNDGEVFLNVPNQFPNQFEDITGINANSSKQLLVAKRGHIRTTFTKIINRLRDELAKQAGNHVLLATFTIIEEKRMSITVLDRQIMRLTTQEDEQISELENTNAYEEVYAEIRILYEAAVTKKQLEAAAAAIPAPAAAKGIREVKFEAIKLKPFSGKPGTKE